MARWIISHFPEHHSYLEPFFGSGAVLFHKARSPIETINDLDGEVVNFFWWIRHDPERLAHALWYLPYARQVYEEAFRAETEDSFTKAVAFCIRQNMAYGPRTNGEKSGWRRDVQGREQAYAARNWTTLPERLWQAAERLRGVQIENREAVDVMQGFHSPRVLIYADPPYVLETRRKKQYRYELDDEGHEKMLDALLVHEGPVLISGYDSSLYREKLRGWHLRTRNSYTQSQEKRKEILWMNFEPKSRSVCSTDACPGRHR